MKKIIKLSLIFLIVMCIVGNVYGVLKCNVDIVTAKTEYSKNAEFTVDINLANVNADKGIIALGGILEYDKDSLTLVKMEGKGEWTKPSYNEANGKFVMDRGSVGTSNETAFTITFKVKEGSKRNLTIALRDISISDGSATHKINLQQKNITIKDGTTNTPPDNNTIGNTIENTINNSKGNTVYPNGTLPKTGESNMITVMAIFMIAFIMIITFSVGKIRIINKKEMKK